MAVVDLTLPINRHMRGIPDLREYEENPTRCVVLSCMGEVQKEHLESRAIELDENLELTLHMLSRLEILTHIGTHIDAPCHFLETGGWSVEQIPLEHTIGKGRVVPLTHLQGRERISADEIIKTGVEIDDSVIPVSCTPAGPIGPGTLTNFGVTPYSWTLPQRSTSLKKAAKRSLSIASPKRPSGSALRRINLPDATTRPCWATRPSLSS